MGLDEGGVAGHLNLHTELVFFRRPVAGHKMISWISLKLLVKSLS